MWLLCLQAHAHCAVYANSTDDEASRKVIRNAHRPMQRCFLPVSVPFLTVEPFQNPTASDLAIWSVAAGSCWSCGRRC